MRTTRKALYRKIRKKRSASTEPGLRPAVPNFVTQGFLVKFNRFFASALFAAFAVPAFAGVTVASPTAGESVNTSFTLSANASTCSNQQVGTMGYSWDSNSTTTTSSGNSIGKTISAPSTGKHTVHVKAWGLSGAACVADVTVSVNGPVVTASTSGALSAPSNAIKVSALQTLGNWKHEHDGGDAG